MKNKEIMKSKGKKRTNRKFYNTRQKKRIEEEMNRRFIPCVITRIKRKMNTEILSILDTGASENFISEKFCKESLNIKTFDSVKRDFITGTGDNNKSMGRIKLDIILGKERYEIKNGIFNVMKNSQEEIIIGTGIMKDWIIDLHKDEIRKRNEKNKEFKILSIGRIMFKNYK